MGRGLVGEWPSGGRPQKGQCQTPVFLTAFRKTNDQYEKRIANFVKKISLLPGKICHARGPLLAWFPQA